ncbi:MAG TPA: hypothetical protein GXX24_09620 [Paracoccus solventivorans]|uniref:Uncharacterized protein n=1 Tax=Paracoccus solventivorans TaxID=53463 RepID=A0A832PMZ5_9RHOB|nr:hypothetical protein [Paracoccus solventivorans]HHW34378.1 hypothetical protein [Paracoccus solventivorans]
MKDLDQSQFGVAGKNMSLGGSNGLSGLKAGTKQRKSHVCGLLGGVVGFSLMAAGLAQAAELPEGFVLLGSEGGIVGAQVMPDGSLLVTMADGSTRSYAPGEFVILDEGRIAVLAETQVEAGGDGLLAAVGGVVAAAAAAGAMAGGGGGGGGNGFALTFVVENVVTGGDDPAIAFSGTAAGPITVRFDGATAVFSRGGVEAGPVTLTLDEISPASGPDLHALRIVLPNGAAIAFEGAYTGLQAIVFDVLDAVPGQSDLQGLTIDTSGLSGVDHLIFAFEGHKDEVHLSSASNLDGITTLEVQKGTVDISDLTSPVSFNYVVNSGLRLTAAQFVDMLSLVSISGLGRLTVVATTPEELAQLQAALADKLIIGFKGGADSVTIEAPHLDPETVAAVEAAIRTASLPSFVELVEAVEALREELLGGGDGSMASTLQELVEQIVTFKGWADEVSGDLGALQGAVEDLQTALAALEADVLTALATEIAALKAAILGGDDLDFATLAAVGEELAALSERIGEPAGEGPATGLHALLGDLAGDLRDEVAGLETTLLEAIDTALAAFELKIQGLSGTPDPADFLTLKGLRDLIGAPGDDQTPATGVYQAIGALAAELDALIDRLDLAEAALKVWDADLLTRSADEIFGGSSTVQNGFLAAFATEIAGYDAATITLTVTGALTVAQATALSRAGFDLLGVDKVSYTIRDAYKTVEAALSDPDTNAALAGARQVLAYGNANPNAIDLMAFGPEIALRIEAGASDDSIATGAGDDSIHGGLGADTLWLTGDGDDLSADTVVYKTAWEGAARPVVEVSFSVDAADYREGSVLRLSVNGTVYSHTTAAGETPAQALTALAAAIAAAAPVAEVRVDAATLTLIGATPDARLAVLAGGLDGAGAKDIANPGMLTVWEVTFPGGADDYPARTNPGNSTEFNRKISITIAGVKVEADVVAGDPAASVAALAAAINAARVEVSADGATLTAAIGAIQPGDISGTTLTLRAAAVRAEGEDSATFAVTGVSIDVAGVQQVTKVGFSAEDGDYYDGGKLFITIAGVEIEADMVAGDAAASIDALSTAIGSAVALAAGTPGSLNGILEKAVIDGDGILLTAATEGADALEATAALGWPGEQQRATVTLHGDPAHVAGDDSVAKIHYQDGKAHLTVTPAGSAPVVVSAEIGANAAETAANLAAAVEAAMAPAQYALFYNYAPGLIRTDLLLNTTDRGSAKFSLRFYIDGIEQYTHVAITHPIYGAAETLGEVIDLLNAQNGDVYRLALDPENNRILVTPTEPDARVTDPAYFNLIDANSEIIRNGSITSTTLPAGALHGLIEDVSVGGGVLVLTTAEGDTHGLRLTDAYFDGGQAHVTVTPTGGGAGLSVSAEMGADAAETTANLAAAINLKINGVPDGNTPGVLRLGEGLDASLEIIDNHVSESTANATAAQGGRKLTLTFDTYSGGEFGVLQNWTLLEFTGGYKVSSDFFLDSGGAPFILNNGTYIRFADLQSFADTLVNYLNDPSNTEFDIGQNMVSATVTGNKVEFYVPVDDNNFVTKPVVAAYNGMSEVVLNYTITDAEGVSASRTMVWDGRLQHTIYTLQFASSNPVEVATMSASSLSVTPMLEQLLGKITTIEGIAGATLEEGQIVLTAEAGYTLDFSLTINTEAFKALNGGSATVTGTFEEGIFIEGTDPDPDWAALLQGATVDPNDPTKIIITAKENGKETFEVSSITLDHPGAKQLASVTLDSRESYGESFTDAGEVDDSSYGRGAAVYYQGGKAHITITPTGGDAVTISADMGADAAETAQNLADAINAAANPVEPQKMVFKITEPFNADTALNTTDAGVPKFFLSGTLAGQPVLIDVANDEIPIAETVGFMMGTLQEWLDEVYNISMTWDYATGTVTLTANDPTAEFADDFIFDFYNADQYAFGAEGEIETALGPLAGIIGQAVAEDGRILLEAAVLGKDSFAVSDITLDYQGVAQKATASFSTNDGNYYAGGTLSLVIDTTPGVDGGEVTITANMVAGNAAASLAALKTAVQAKMVPEGGTYSFKDALDLSMPLQTTGGANDIVYLLDVQIDGHFYQLSKKMSDALPAGTTLGDAIEALNTEMNGAGVLSLAADGKIILTTTGTVTSSISFLAFRHENGTYYAAMIKPTFEGPLHDLIGEVTLENGTFTLLSAEKAAHVFDITDAEISFAGIKQQVTVSFSGADADYFNDGSSGAGNDGQGLIGVTINGVDISVAMTDNDAEATVEALRLAIEEKIETDTDFAAKVASVERDGTSIVLTATEPKTAAEITATSFADVNGTAQVMRFDLDDLTFDYAAWDGISPRGTVQLTLGGKLVAGDIGDDLAGTLANLKQAIEDGKDGWFGKTTIKAAPGLIQAETAAGGQPATATLQLGPGNLGGGNMPLVGSDPVVIVLKIDGVSSSLSYSWSPGDTLNDLVNEIASDFPGVSPALQYDSHTDTTALFLIGSDTPGATLVIEKLSFSIRSDYDADALEMVGDVAIDAGALTITASAIGKDMLDANTSVMQSVVDQAASKTQVLRLTLPNSSFDDAQNGYSVTVTIDGIETHMTIGHGTGYDIDLDGIAADAGYPADFGAEYIAQALVDKLSEVHLGGPDAVVGSITRGYVSGPSSFTAATDKHDAGFVIEFTAARPGRDLMGSIGSSDLSAVVVTEASQAMSYDVVRPGLLVWKLEEKTGIGADSGTQGLSAGTDETRVNSGDTGASDHGLAVSTSRAGKDPDPVDQSWTNPGSGYDGTTTTDGDGDFLGDAPLAGAGGGIGQDYLNPGGGRVDGTAVSGPEGYYGAEAATGAEGVAQTHANPDSGHDAASGETTAGDGDLYGSDPGTWTESGLDTDYLNGGTKNADGIYTTDRDQNDLDGRVTLGDGSDTGDGGTTGKAAGTIDQDSVGDQSITKTSAGMTVAEVMAMMGMNPNVAMQEFTRGDVFTLEVVAGQVISWDFDDADDFADDAVIVSIGGVPMILAGGPDAGLGDADASGTFTASVDGVIHFAILDGEIGDAPSKLTIGFNGNHFTLDNTHAGFKAFDWDSATRTIVSAGNPAPDLIHNFQPDHDVIALEGDLAGSTLQGALAIRHGNSEGETIHVVRASGQFSNHGEDGLTAISFDMKLPDAVTPFRVLATSGGAISYVAPGGDSYAMSFAADTEFASVAEFVAHLTGTMTGSQDHMLDPASWPPLGFTFEDGVLTLIAPQGVTLQNHLDGLTLESVLAGTPGFDLSTDEFGLVSAAVNAGAECSVTAADLAASDRIAALLDGVFDFTGSDNGALNTSVFAVTAADDATRTAVWVHRQSAADDATVEAHELSLLAIVNTTGEEFSYENFALQIEDGYQTPILYTPV